MGVDDRPHDRQPQAGAAAVGGALAAALPERFVIRRSSRTGSPSASAGPSLCRIVTPASAASSDTDPIACRAASARSITGVCAVSQDWPIAIPLTALAGGLGATLLIGAVAGLYPAIRASRLDPVEALANS